MVSKGILSQYISIQKEIEDVQRRIADTERQISFIEAEGSVKDSVKGGMGGIQHFTIEGFPSEEYSRKKTLLWVRKATLSSLEMELTDTVNKIEEFLRGVDSSHVRTIIRLRYVDGLRWEEVARRIGGGNTADSVRKAFERYMDGSS